MSSHKEANDYMLIESGRKYNGELHKIKLEGIFLIQPTAFEHAFWALCMGGFWDTKPTNHGSPYRPIR